MVDGILEGLPVNSGGSEGTPASELGSRALYAHLRTTALFNPKVGYWRSYLPHEATLPPERVRDQLLDVVLRSELGVSDFSEVGGESSVSAEAIAVEGLEKLRASGFHIGKAFHIGIDVWRQESISGDATDGPAKSLSDRKIVDQLLTILIERQIDPELARTHLKVLTGLQDFLGADHNTLSKLLLIYTELTVYERETSEYETALAAYRKFKDESGLFDPESGEWVTSSYKGRKARPPTLTPRMVDLLIETATGEPGVNKHLKLLEELYKDRRSDLWFHAQRRNERPGHRDRSPRTFDQLLRVIILHEMEQAAQIKQEGV